jgi:CDP-paratose 2-epimerase
MTLALVTGSACLIGSEAARHFTRLGLDVVGVDNDMRREFFGPKASTPRNVAQFASELGACTHYEVDIRDRDALAKCVDAVLADVLQDVERAGRVDVEAARTVAAR